MNFNVKWITILIGFCFFFIYNFGYCAAMTDMNNNHVNKHKPVIFLKAVAVEKQVLISFYKSSWFFYDKTSNFDELYGKLRIYRKKIVCDFGKDGKELFDGLNYCDADLIYEGPIKCENNRYFSFIDKDVVVGETYVYWAGSLNGQATGPFPVKVRDPDVWWSENRITTEVYDLKKNYPELVKVITIGKTIRGRNILALEIGHSKKTIACIGAIHAGESGPELIIGAAKILLKEHRDIFDKIGIIAVPAVNMDERQNEVDGVPWYLRENSNSVDLNRNFPTDWQQIGYDYGLDTSDPNSTTYRGPEPASEPETKALIAFLKSHSPAVLLSYHGMACITGKCLCATKAALNDEDYMQKCRKVYDAYWQGYSDEQADKNPIDRLKFMVSTGSLPIWCYRELGIPAFDIESHRSNEHLMVDKDETNLNLLLKNQSQHACALLNLMKEINK